MSRRPPDLEGVRVGIDARSLRIGPAGIATYVRNLMARIPWLEPLEDPRPSNNLLWNHSRPLWAQWRRKWHIYHAPTYTLPLLNFCKVVLMVADISYLVRDEWYPYANDPLRRRYYRASLFRAHRILVPSDFTAGELVRLFPALKERIRRVYLGVSPDFRPRPRLGEQVRKRLDLPRRFVLHVGDIHPRRNLDALAEACRSLQLPLVLVGKVLRGGEGLVGHSRHLSDLSLQDLVGVYNAASAMGYPSSYEGFGFPMVEAMACGLPVVASNRSCLPEVAGEGALLVDPVPRDLAQALGQVLDEPSKWMERGRRNAARFTWDNTARQTLQVYRELIGSSRPDLRGAK
ncbi:MAG TPA: glycosyltransferase family 1 protein [Acidobacteriota bacterium]|nr:glycosyltransferase family 1 protein [Acidobacteriota bacterium]